MAGWRKAWLSVLDRGGGGGGGSSGSLKAHLNGLLSPSSSSSSLVTAHKRGSGLGGRHGGGPYVSTKAALACFSVVLVIAFFYVSITGRPAAEDSFPTPTGSSAASGALLSSNSSTPTSPRKSPPPHPPISPNVSSTGNATVVAPRRVQSNNSDDYWAPADGSGQPALVPEEDMGKAQGPLYDAGNATISGSDEEPVVGNGTKAQDVTAMPTPPWRRADAANSTGNPIIGAPDEPSDSDGATGNSTDTAVPSSKEDRNANASVDNVPPNSTRRAALPSRTPDQRKEDRRRRKRASMARHKQRSTRRRKDDDTGTGTVTAGANTSVAVGPGNHRVVWTSGVQDLVTFAKCDLFSGRWVREENHAFYPPRSCPHIDGDFNCHKNGRQDTGFLNWRWQPTGCNIPRMNVTDFLERLRGQRIIFVGDSLNRNMWESLVCTLRHGVRNKKNVYEKSGKNQFKTRGFYSFKFRDYNCSVDFIRSTFLVKETVRESPNGTVLDEKLRLDELDATTPAYQTADIVVVNTGHWWTHPKTSKGLNYYQEGYRVHHSLEVMEAYRKALTTWAKWVDKNINPTRTQIVFRGLSLTHFKGGQWNSGGRCHRETEPIFNHTYLTEYPERMRVLEKVMSRMKTPVIYLNISRLTDYRKDGHPSVYRVRYDTEEERMAAAATKQDCSHWCLPGVPDTWNELLYASLLQAGKGSWRL
uniref:Trichome birefringence-like N-terminal domain-containing protein n=1 Tax=Triticum urartu TaxID=4572 RepID=A0A8R7TK67_TRIUA